MDIAQKINKVILLTKKTTTTELLIQNATVYQMSKNARQSRNSIIKEQTKKKQLKTQNRIDSLHAMTDVM